MKIASHTPDSAAVVVVGDVMVDTFVITDRPLTSGEDHPMRSLRRVGGQAANTSAWLAWAGTPVYLVAVCGDDAEGDWAEQSLASVGVRTRLVRDGGSTGSCLVIVDSTRERTMFSSPGANSVIAEVGRHQVEGVWNSLGSTALTHLHLSGYLLDRDPMLAVDLARHAPKNATVSIDTAAFHPSSDHRRALADLIAHLDVLIGTADELGAFSDSSVNADVASLARTWRDRFNGVVVVKQGSAGASVLADGELLQASALPTEVVDTTGAGDAFTAGFLAAWILDHAGLTQALRSGVEAASQAVGRIGAAPPAQEGR